MNLFADIDLERRSRIDWTPPTPPNLGDAPLVILDTETTGLKWWTGDLPIGIAVWVPDGPLSYLPFGHKGGGNLDESVVKDWAKEQLKGKKIVGQNIKFDNHMLYNWGVDLESLGCQLYDTSHLAALLDDHRRIFNLDTLSKELLGEGEGKVKTTSITNEKIDPQIMAEYHAGEISDYAIMDVKLTGRLWNLMLPKIHEEELDRVVDLESRLIYPVCEMERNPPRIDILKLEAWEKKSEVELNRLVEQLHQETGIKLLKPGSPKSWIKLFKHLDLTVRSFTDKGEPSFTDVVLEKIDHPMVQLGRKIRQLYSLRSKYLVAYIERMDIDGRLRTNFHQLRADEGGTITGRFSSSAMRLPSGEKIGTNLQNVYTVKNQRERFGGDYIIRELFLPDEGEWFSADAKQIEYRIFAHYTNSKKIIASYDADPETDYHQIVMDMLSPFKDNVSRRLIKNLNFAKIFGAGLDKMSEILGIPRSESDPFVMIYDRELPEALALLALASQVARRKGFVKTFLGRKSRFPKAQRLHKAINSIIQGTAADIMKEKMIQAYKHRKEFGITLRLTVHDELDGDTPDKEMARRLQELLNVQSFDLKVPILWSMKTGANWADC